MEIFLNNKQNFLTIDLEYWQNFALKALQILEQPDNSELSLTFVNDQEIQELNKSYRQIDKPTDVLSFPFDNSFNLPIKV
ncbi:MAG: rRNA maturation RNase YbeY, partial [Candidatus Sericytochromatia bacterium]|nr:rRNA maturation RNase YbeY [Candidatus Sericytochromatia bacterium]